MGTVVALPIDITILPPPKLAFHSVILPKTTSLDLKSVAAVSVGLICRPLVIPLAPQAWLIVSLMCSDVYVAVPDVGANVPIFWVRNTFPVVVV